MAASAVKQPVVSGVELSIVGHLNRQGWLRLPPEAGQALLRRPSHTKRMKLPMPGRGRGHRQAVTGSDKRQKKNEQAGSDRQ